MNSKYFCVLPWYSREFFAGQTSACCLLPNGHDINVIRQDLLQGVPSSACKKCWDLESIGQESRRQQENKFLDYKLDRDIEKIEQDCRQNLHKELVYQIYLSNLCNQACVTCNDSASTKWAELKRQVGLPSKKLQVTEVNSLGIDFANAKRMSILGGEPLFDPQLEVLLSQLAEHNNNDCFVSFVTNGSVPLSQKLVDLLSSFSDINICVSIDGIGSRFEYMRWPGQWNSLVSNLDQYRAVTNNKVSVSYTVSSVNAIYYDETVEWFKSQGLPYNHTIVYQPSWASLKSMPALIKDHLRDHEFFKNHLEITGQELSTKQFAEFIRHQDKMKKISLIDYMPELAVMLKF